MSNDNVVKIGTALKWRGVFDKDTIYYQDNVTTACGCVFRCKVLQAQGKLPVRFTEDQGHLEYINTDIWDVVVDMKYYYDAATDSIRLIKETWDSIKYLEGVAEDHTQQLEDLHEHDDLLDGQIKDLQDKDVEHEIILDEIKADDLDQWSHINNAENVQTQLQKNVNDLAVENDEQWDFINNLDDSVDKNAQDIADIKALDSQQEQRLTDLETENDEQQTSIDDHQAKLDVLMEGFTTINLGKWQNDYAWNNESEWPDVFFTNGFANDKITSFVRVIDYDPETLTITL